METYTSQYLAILELAVSTFHRDSTVCLRFEGFNYFYHVGSKYIKFVVAQNSRYMFHHLAL